MLTRRFLAFSAVKLFIVIEVQVASSKCVGTVEVLASEPVPLTEQYVDTMISSGIRMEMFHLVFFL